MKILNNGLWLSTVEAAVLIAAATAAHDYAADHHEKRLFTQKQLDGLYDFGNMHGITPGDALTALRNRDGFTVTDDDGSLDRGSRTPTTEDIENAGDQDESGNKGSMLDLISLLGAHEDDDPEYADDDDGQDFDEPDFPSAPSDDSDDIGGEGEPAIF